MTKKKSPLISVIMATYNRTELLPRSIESVLNQTFANFELIIVDDGSTDETQSILKNYEGQDSRIVVAYQLNSGLATGLNHGLQLAKGKYIALMDDDDISMPRRLEKQYSYLENFPNEMACVCYFYLIGQNQVKDRGYEHRQPLKKSSRNLTIPSGFILISASLFKKEALLAVDGFRPIFTSAEDLDLTLRFQEKFSAGIVKDFLYLYNSPYENKHSQMSNRHPIKQLYCHILAYTSAWYRRYKGYDPLVDYKNISENLFIKLINPLPKQTKRAILHSTAYILNIKKADLTKQEIEQLFRIMLLCNAEFYLLLKRRVRVGLKLIRQRRWQEIAALWPGLSI